MKRYIIRREDFFSAVAAGQLSIDVRILYAGSIWMDVFLSETERNNYTFPIEKA